MVASCGVRSWTERKLELSTSSRRKSSLGYTDSRRQSMWIRSDLASRQSGVVLSLSITRYAAHARYATADGIGRPCRKPNSDRMDRLNGPVVRYS